MAARRTGLAVLVIAAAGVGGCLSPERERNCRPALTDNRGRPSLGCLEHRGERHALRDRMDPNYRAASGDDFARKFDPETALAEPWAGMSRHR